MPFPNSSSNSSSFLSAYTCMYLIEGFQQKKSIKLFLSLNGSLCKYMLEQLRTILTRLRYQIKTVEPNVEFIKV